MSPTRKITPHEFKGIAADLQDWFINNVTKNKADRLVETEFLREVRHIGVTRPILQHFMKEMNHEATMVHLGGRRRGMAYHGLRMKDRSKRFRRIEQVTEAQMFRAFREHVMQNDVIRCAEFFGVGKRTVYNWESGVVDVPSSTSLIMRLIKSKKESQHAKETLANPPKWFTDYLAASTTPAGLKDERAGKSPDSKKQNRPKPSKR